MSTTERQPGGADEQRPAEKDQLPIDPEARDRTTEDQVDEASDDSFPASDPPSFTRTTTFE